MKICIVGGGLSGLVSALELAGTHQVDLFEKRPIPGGCLGSYRIGDYWIEEYYHHCFAGDVSLLDLFDRLQVTDRLEWLRGSTGYYVDGIVHPLTTPIEILRYPHLTLTEKARLGLLTLRSRRLDVSALDGITAKEFILENLGPGIYASFFEPLLKSKFGDRRDEVSAAWLISRIAIRSDRGAGGERLGYLKGGFQQFVARLVEEATRKGASIMLDTPVKEIRRKGDGWVVDGSAYDCVISTVPPQVTAELANVDMNPVPYQGAACMTLALDRDVTNGIYWLNMKDTAPYGAVVSHTNFAPLSWYGEHIVYLASYFTKRLPEGFEQSMLRDFCRRFSVSEDEVHWHRLAVDPYAGPIYTTGLRDRLPAYEEHGLYLAGMFSPPNYPERSMNGSVIAGQEVAKRVLARYPDA
ncbi:NAD(P)/FAD-dependent oxidoreductase [Methanoculleus thermophilus]|jgi:protoporphyrinogen oxidase|uniref:Protoporphyrinogen oxidase n=1 Tax=Methanoculleus thermophilus TaxID=2200 RepID=A0A1G8Y6F0_9EURY|nr:NAD(P)/FAD-dependent oxidoreductase [Methanoculleus thermophilus]NLN09829.1 NAD(P)/FAD-dependent oxidoreductase [Methanoculleus thermophilus]SDJ98331.1 Protoporphyrinogen oxidase [Methanoculleus thermophilus]HQD25870.1 NAD(P)/FAD-dependent oxidoreductase [Methanoculleus thermophilus]